MTTDWNSEITREEMLWVLGSFCAVHRLPFDAQLAQNRFPPPYHLPSLIHAGRELGFKVAPTHVPCTALNRLVLPCLAILTQAPTAVLPTEGMHGAGGGPANAQAQGQSITPVLVAKVDAERVLCFEAGAQTPTTLTLRMRVKIT